MTDSKRAFKFSFSFYGTMDHRLVSRVRRESASARASGRQARAYSSSCGKTVQLAECSLSGPPHIFRGYLLSKFRKLGYEEAVIDVLVTN